MGLNYLPKTPEIGPCEPAATSAESIDDLFSQDAGAVRDGETPGWWILGLAICLLPWIIGIALYWAL